MEKLIKPLIWLAVLAIVAVGFEIYSISRKLNLDYFDVPAPVPQQETPIVQPDQPVENLPKQKYVNEEFGFEFEYPGDWKIDAERSIENEVVFDIGISESREAVEFLPNEKRLSIRQRIDEKIPDKTMIVKMSEGRVGDESALKVETTEFGMTYIFFDHDNIAYTITTGGRMLLNGVVATFKFVEKVPEWQTYRNEKYGFEFQYPGGWVVSDQDTGALLSNVDNTNQQISFDFANLNPKKMSLDGWLKSQQWPSKEPVEKQFSKYKEIDDRPTVIQNQTGTVYAMDGDAVLIVSNGIGMERKVIEEELFSKIISTFKFTK